jgi:hypothetical protein
MSLFQELKRRKVLRVGAAYVVVSWVIIEVVVTLRELFPEMPLWLGQALIVLLVVGIVPVLIFSWLYELTPTGVERDRQPPEAPRPGVRGVRRYADLAYSQHNQYRRVGVVNPVLVARDLRFGPT